jgi:putative flippase GtrA
MPPAAGEIAWPVLRLPSVLRRRVLRYLAASALNVVIGQALLLFAFTILLWSPVKANCFSAVVAALPAYLINRRWVWAQQGRSRLLHEVLPFWLLALAGLIISSGTVALAARMTVRVTDDRAIQAAAVSAAAFAAYGLVWVVRFVVLNAFIFTSPKVESAVPEIAHAT